MLVSVQWHVNAFENLMLNIGLNTQVTDLGIQCHSNKTVSGYKGTSNAGLIIYE